MDRIRNKFNKKKTYDIHSSNVSIPLCHSIDLLCASFVFQAFAIDDKDEQQRRINQVVGYLVGVGCMACVATFTMVTMITYCQKYWKSRAAHKTYIFLI